MGIYDRDYAREPEGGVQLRMPVSWVNRIILINVAVYLVQYFGSPAFTEALALPADWFRQPWRFYELITYGFLHARDSVAHIIFNMLGLWFFGRELEARYGSREFVLFYLTAIILAGLVWSGATTLVNPASNHTALGASGGVVATIILFAFNYPRRTVYLNLIIPVPMWALGIIIVVSDLSGATGVHGGNVAFTAHLGGAAYGALYYYTRWLPLRWLGGLKAKLPKVSRPTLRVHDPDDLGDKLQDELDRILAKINSQGQDSLTRAEKRTLEQASRKYREGRP